MSSWEFIYTVYRVEFLSIFLARQQRRLQHPYEASRDLYVAQADNPVVW